MEIDACSTSTSYMNGLSGPVVCVVISTPVATHVTANATSTVRPAVTGTDCRPTPLTVQLSATPSSATEWTPALTPPMPNSNRCDPSGPPVISLGRSCRGTSESTTSAYPSESRSPTEVSIDTRIVPAWGAVGPSWHAAPSPKTN